MRYYSSNRSDTRRHKVSISRLLFNCKRLESDVRFILVHTLGQPNFLREGLHYVERQGGITKVLQSRDFKQPETGINHIRLRHTPPVVYSYMYMHLNL